MIKKTTLLFLLDMSLEQHTLAQEVFNVMLHIVSETAFSENVACTSVEQVELAYALTISYLANL